MERTSQPQMGFVAVSAAALAVLIGGCGPTTTPTTGITPTKGSTSANPTTAPTGDASIATSPHLKLVVEPRTARAGALVAIKVTGCIDPSGLHHALSYTDKYTAARDISATLTGTNLTARFAVPATGLPKGIFTAQCGGSHVTTPFTVAGRKTTLGLVVAKTKVADAYRVAIAPARRRLSDGSFVVIPGRATLTYLIPNSFVPDRGITLVGAIQVTADGPRVTALSIVGG